jgi:hypothetical protein
MRAGSVLVASIFIILLALAVLLVGSSLHRGIAQFERRRRTRADAAAHPQIVRYLADPSEASALGNNPAVTRAALRYLTKVRGESHDALESYLEQCGVVDRALLRARRRGWVGRARAIEILGAVGTPRAERVVIRGLRDRRLEARVVAARALGRLGAWWRLHGLMDAIRGREGQ